ncbi:hypothetical protein HID58_022863, partial [Brassica napus]
YCYASYQPSPLAYCYVPLLNDSIINDSTQWRLLQHSKRAGIQVSVNVDKPLQFEHRIEFPNGCIERIFFSYEEEKRQKISTPRENRAYHPSQKESSKERKSSYRDHPRKDDVWRRLELPPCASSAYGMDISSNAPHGEIPYSHKNRGPKQTESYRGRYSNHRHQETRAWRPRSPPRTNPYTDMAPVSSRAPLSAKDALTQTVSDSQRTIFDKLGHLDLGDLTSLIPQLPAIENLEPEDMHQAHQHTISPRPEASSPDHKNNIKQLDFDFDLDLGQDLEITLADDEIALVDSMVMETERLEMDVEMLDNDDLHDDVPDDNAEKIDAISQLSPVNAETTNELQKDPPIVPLPAAPPQAQNALTSTQDIAPRASLPMTSAKGYLKKLVPKNPELKDTKPRPAIPCGPSFNPNLHIYDLID